MERSVTNLKAPTILSSATKASSTPNVTFVVGVPRSGTTWLTSMLGRHPKSAACYHAGFFHALEPLQHWFASPGEYSKEVVSYSPVARGGNPDGSNKSFPTKKLVEFFSWDSMAKEFLEPLAAEVFQTVIEKTPNACVLIEQTPENLEHWPLIHQTLPNAKFLHIIRDPRSVFASMKAAAKKKKYGRDFTTNATEFGELWNAYMNLADELKQSGAGYRAIQYEQLLADGPRHLIELFEWMNLSANHELCEQIVASCSLSKLSSELHRPEEFFRHGKNAWQRELSKSDIRCIEFVCGSKMRNLYRLSNLGNGKPLGVRMYPMSLRCRDTSKRVLSTLGQIFGLPRHRIVKSENRIERDVNIR